MSSGNRPATSNDGDSQDTRWVADHRSPDETPLKSQLLPRISFRSLFVLTLVASIFAAIAKAAGEGSAVAFGVISALVFLLTVAVSLAIVFLFSWAVANTWYTGDAKDPASPFAEDQLPPQILPPSDPVI